MDIKCSIKGKVISVSFFCSWLSDVLTLINLKTYPIQREFKTIRAIVFWNFAKCSVAWSDISLWKKKYKKTKTKKADGLLTIFLRCFLFISFACRPLPSPLLNFIVMFFKANLEHLCYSSWYSETKQFFIQGKTCQFVQDTGFVSNKVHTIWMNQWHFPKKSLER